MDDYILQILRANNVAKIQVKQTLESHADDIQKLQQQKDAIDYELDQRLQEETRKLYESYEGFKSEIEPVYAQEYETRVLDLRSRFEDAKNNWYQILLEGVVNPDGK